MASNKDQEEYLAEVARQIAGSEKRIENLRIQIANIAALNGDTQLQEKIFAIMLKTVATMRRHRDQLAALPPFPSHPSDEL